MMQSCYAEPKRGGAMSGPIDIRAMTRPDLDIAVDWAADEGWNPGLVDADAFYAADSEGFLMAWLGEEPVASISVVRYGGEFGFLGFYICRPEHRGKGFGWAVWQAGLARLEGRTVGLDGVADQQDNYRKSGFVLAHRNVRFGGQVTCDPPADPRVRPIEPGLIAAVTGYDMPFFPAPRRRFLDHWLTPHPERFGFALIEDGRVAGYGVIRDCRSGCKIGPLLSDSEEGADLLFRALSGARPGQALYLDLPEPNVAASRLAERYGLKPVFETARMYRGDAPDLPLERICGITTFELG
jgi:hypothetical protein